MAEIKSTLDIIMEKTKTLTMTDEERIAFQRNELQGKVRGWIQKHLDGIMDSETIRSYFEAEQKKYPELGNILKTELLAQINFEGDNRDIFRLLEELLGIKSTIFNNLIQSFKNDLDTLWREYRDTLLYELTKRKIYGTSVIPNPKKDENWEAHRQQLTLRFRQQLQSSIDIL